MPCSPRTENESHLHFHSSLLSFFFLSPKLRENFLKLQFYLKKKSPNGKNFSERNERRTEAASFRRIEFTAAFEFLFEEPRSDQFQSSRRDPNRFEL